MVGGTLPGAEISRSKRTADSSDGDRTDTFSRMMLSVQLRLAGKTSDAMRVLESSLGALRAAENPLIEFESNMSSFAYLQAGITAFLAGDLHTANAWLLRGGAVGADTRFGFTARDSAFKFAVLQALFGDPAEATRALARGDASGRTASWAESWIDSTGELARALVRLDDEGGSLPEPVWDAQWRAYGEMWPFELWYRVRLGMKRHDHSETLAFLKSVEAMRLPGNDGDGLAAAVIPLGFASVELAQGRAAAAETRIAQAPQALLLTRLLRARLDHSRGKFERAAAEASARLVEAKGFLRLTVELTGILTASQVALGTPSRHTRR